MTETVSNEDLFPDPSQCDEAHKDSWKSAPEQAAHLDQAHPLLKANLFRTTLTEHPPDQGQQEELTHNVAHVLH